MVGCAKQDTAFVVDPDRKLLIDDDEAEIIRSIFRRYKELRSVAKLVDELAREDVRTKVRQYRNGRTVGGVHFGRGSLSQLLQNLSGDPRSTALVKATYAAIGREAHS